MIFSNDTIELNVSLKGAEIKSLKYKNIELLNDNENEWEYSSPYLFPSVGRSKDNETIFNNKIYKMPMHGLIRNLDFKFDGKSFILNSSDYKELKEFYPFDFQLKISYNLYKDQVKAKIEIQNLSNDVMPFNFGLHPAFKTRNLDCYEIIFEKPETFESPLIVGGLLDFSNPTYKFKDLKNLKLNYDLFKVDTIILKNLKSRWVKLINTNNFPNIKFHFPSFNNFAIWTNETKKTNFICLEPWIGHGDYIDTDKVFSNRPDIININPKEKTVLNYEIKMEE